MDNEHLGQKLYRQVWQRTGGKPWTFILRDSHKKHPITWIIGSLLLGILMGHVFWNTSKEEDERYG